MSTSAQVDPEMQLESRSREDCNPQRAVGMRDFSTTLPIGRAASDQTNYTGIAGVNPNPDAVRAAIEVYDKNGHLIAFCAETIPAHGGASRLLTQYCPAMEGHNHAGGYIRVRTSQGVAGFAVFGTHDFSTLSAIPSQKVRQPEEEQSPVSRRSGTPVTVALGVDRREYGLHEVASPPSPAGC